MHVVLHLQTICMFMRVLGADDNNKTELLREISPDGNYVLRIDELGEPNSFYKIDYIQVTLYENDNSYHYYADFIADVSTNGGHAKYEIEWLEDGVQIVLTGHMSQYYILPFKTLEDSDKL